MAECGTSSGVLSDSINVVVIGSTGVTGRYVVGELLQCPEIACVRTVARSKYLLPVEYTKSMVVASALKQGKLVEHITDMEAVSDEELRDIFRDVHTFYNCFGCALGNVVSRERFVQIDMDIPVRFAQIAKEMGVRHVSLLTSAGADSKSTGQYYRVKAFIEDAFRKISFPVLSIFRPGVLGRKERMRFGAKLYSLLHTPIQTDDLARGIVEESLSVISGKSLSTGQTYGNTAIKALNTERITKLRSFTTDTVVKEIEAVKPIDCSQTADKDTPNPLPQPDENTSS